jgi:transitional endoplasmic reticulum ATPase
MVTQTAADKAAERQAEIASEVMANLALLSGQLDGEDTVTHHDGTDIRLPHDMDEERAWRLLRKLAVDKEEEYQVHRTLNYLPWDGARAVRDVIKRRFGYTMGKATRGFMGMNPPQLINIETGVNTTESVPWGRVQLPYFDEGYLDVGGTRDGEKGLVLALTATCKRKHARSVEGLFNEIEAYLKENSIYRGKAITASEKPTFVDVSGIDPNDVIYTAEVMEDAATYIWANIWYPMVLRKHGQLGKRLTVVHGTYGVGKTLMALLTAYYCEQARFDPKLEEVTFIIVRPGQDDWRYAFNLARLYGRCIIFIEDVDTMIDTNDPAQVSMLLDQLDGLRAKGLDASMVFTTNHITKIHKGALRPGRTDGLIEIGFMDRAGVEALAWRTITDLDPKIDFDAVFEAFEGFTPAYVKEVFDRSVRRNIVRNDGRLTQINQTDLIHSANSLRPQLALMEAAPEATKRVGIDGVLSTLIESAVDSVVENRIDGAYIDDEVIRTR